MAHCSAVLMFVTNNFVIVILCLRVESTIQVADELVAEFADPSNSLASPDQVSIPPC